MYKKIGISFVSSIVLSLVLYPLDTVKRCMQLNGSRGHFNNYKSSLDCIKKISANSGVGALYRGVQLFAIKELLTAFT